MSEHPPPLPAPLYQGSVNTWECDEGGHLNVRFHFERALIGLGHMAHALALPRAFTERAASTLAPLEAHVRFLKEARPPAALTMHGGVTALGASEANLCLDLRHADGAPSACFNLRVAHADTRDFRAFPWSASTRAAAQRLACAMPAHSAPRSIALSEPTPDASLQRAIELGAQRIGASMVLPDQCDAFGRMRMEHFVGRASDSVPNLLARWRQEATAHSGAAPAGAVVEARIVFRRFPRTGDLIELRSGITDAGDKILRLAHWFCDPVSGNLWASMEVVALTFDTVTRKALAPSAEARARIQKLAIKLPI